MRGKRIAVWSAAVLAGGSLYGCSIAGYDVTLDHDYFAGNTAFSINGESCGGAEAKLYLCNYKNLYGRVYGVDLWSYEFEEDSLESYVKSVALDELSRIYCMEQIAKEQGISLDDTDRAKVKKAAVSYDQSLSEEERRYTGIDREQLEEFYTRYALADKLYRAMTDGETVEVSDDDARVIRICQIFVKDEGNASKVKAKLDAGAEFSAVANTYNEAKDYELTAARGQLDPALEEAAFEMDDHEVSGAIPTKDGYYFILCVNKYEERLTEANKEVLLEKRKEQRFADTYSEFIERSQNEWNEHFWDSLTLEGTAGITTDSFFSTYEEYVR